MYDSRNQLNKFFIEKITIPYEIKINNSKDYELKIFNNLVNNYSYETFRSNNKIGQLMILQIAFIGLFLLAFMLISTYLFQQGKLTSGSFVLISSYVIQLTTPFIIVSQNVMQLNGHLISLKKMDYYFKLDKESMIVQPSRLDKSTVNDDVIYLFRNVSLIISDIILKDFNYKIFKNKLYAITGRTGSGKTSFVNYLLGLSKIDSGQLLYKDIDISEAYSPLIFEEVAFVSQKPIMISGSFKENLLYNTREVFNDHYLIYLLEIFNLDYLLNDSGISLNDNIDEIHKNFSGGEMQRISIIRALLKRPQVLILDEPTSALDEMTGLKIINFLKQQIPSIIMITHSKYCIDLSDEVIDIEKIKINYK